MKQAAPAIRYIVNRVSHHATHSGYDQLTRYIESRVVQPNRFRRVLDQLPEWVLANLRRTAGNWYNSTALKMELQQIPDFLYASGQVFHFLYGEDSFHYAGYLNPRKGNKIVASFHMPPEKFLNITRGRRHLKTLDAAVIVAPNQEELFKTIITPARCTSSRTGLIRNSFIQKQLLQAGPGAVFLWAFTCAILRCCGQ
jgi:hypothetical protein